MTNLSGILYHSTK